MKDEEIKLEEIEVGELQELLRTVRVLKFFRCTRIHIHNSRYTRSSPLVRLSVIVSWSLQPVTSSKVKGQGPDQSHPVITPRRETTGRLGKRIL